ncbi:hypothetical protein [Halioglobus sp. Uisw_031]
MSDNSAEIAKWLTRLTHNQNELGFGLFRGYLHSVKKIWLESQTDLTYLR